LEKGLTQLSRKGKMRKGKRHQKPNPRIRTLKTKKGGGDKRSDGVHEGRKRSKN